MSLNLVDIGNEGAFMESWARRQDVLAAMDIAKELSACKVPTKLDKPILTLADLDRAIKKLERLMPRPSDYVTVHLNPKMAEIIGAPALGIRRDIYESVVNPLAPGRFIHVSAEL